MKKIRIFMIALSIILTIILSIETNAAGKPIELSYSIFFPPSHVQFKTAMAWAKEIEKRTKGEVTITMYPAGSLTPAAQCYDGVVDGISDIGFSMFAYFSGRFPVISTLDNPLGYSTALCASRIINQFYRRFKPKELDDVHVLYLHGHGPGFLHTRKPVKTLEDLRGMKIRSAGTTAKIVEALGGIPVSMPQGDTYEALQKGIVDGTLGPIEVLKGWNQAEVIKYTTETYSIGYSASAFVVINLKKWNSLPKNIQKIMDEVSEEWIDKQGKTWDESDKEGREFTLGLGNQIITLSPEEATRWKKRLSPLLDGYGEYLEKKGLPGKQIISETLRLVEQCK